MPSVRVQTLENFKEQIRSFSVKMVYCRFEADPQGDPPIGMRLYFYHEGEVHYLADYASGEKLKITEIPIRVHGSRKEPYISEEDVKSFIGKELAGITVSFDFEI